MQATVLLAIALFVGTNLDTFLVLVAFCLDEDYGAPEILLGHYVGVTLGLVAAVVGAVLAGELLEGWTFLLGLLPIAIALWALRPRTRDETVTIRPTSPDRSRRLLIVTTVAIGLNGENLAVYVPFFAGLPSVQLGVVAVGYFLGAGLMFLVALGFARRTTNYAHPDWMDRWLVPVVLLLVGGYVLVTGWVAV